MSTTQEYWRNVPRKAIAGFLLGVFLLFSTIGFAGDIPSMGREPTLRLVISVLLSGFFPVLYAIAGFALRKKSWIAMIPIFIAQFLVMGFLANLIPDHPQLPVFAASDIARLHARLVFDALSIMAAVGLGYGCFLYVSITESRRYFRVHAEMELAAQIHRVLVPPITRKLGSFEFFGRSVPSGEVGGDLIDLAGSADHWVAYVADVSGHGVAPGVVMGMVKSAARMLLSSGSDTVDLMPRLNEVLYPLKSPDMFITFCFIAQNAHSLRVGLAGHPPILHYSAATRSIQQHDGPNMPLGILPTATYLSAEMESRPGDLFALYTDGFLETANAAGEEFGIAGLSAHLQKHASEPLETISAALEATIAAHGAQFDDQSLLLIRHL